MFRRNGFTCSSLFKEYFSLNPNDREECNRRSKGEKGKGAYLMSTYGIRLLHFNSHDSDRSQDL